jgi:hypothetical protein
MRGGRRRWRGCGATGPRENEGPSFARRAYSAEAAAKAGSGLREGGWTPCQAEKAGRHVGRKKKIHHRDTEDAEKDDCPLRGLEVRGLLI